MKFVSKLMVPGYIAETRNKERFFIFEECISNYKRIISAYSYNGSLKNLNNSEDDIIRIYKPDRFHTLDYILKNSDDMIWQSKDYNIDLSKLKVDTPMIVYSIDPISGCTVKYIRYLAFTNINKRIVYCWNGGCTSLTVKDKSDYSEWTDFELYDTDSE